MWDCLLVAVWTWAESGVEVGERIVGDREGASPGEKKGRYLKKSSYKHNYKPKSEEKNPTTSQKT